MYKAKECKFKRLIHSMFSLFLSVSVVITAIVPVPFAAAQTTVLPAPGKFISPSTNLTPVIVRGLTIHPENPLAFDFIVDTGHTNLSEEQFNNEASKLIKYFLASLTVPENEMWVNLSPYESNRIIPESLGITGLGTDLLAQDYILKQFTASLMYPEDESGREFWDKVKRIAQDRYGISDVPMDMFNKVWIVPDRAVVYEQQESVFVVERHLKVMLEEDYMAFKNGSTLANQMDSTDSDDIQKITADVVREILLPIIEQEVNEGAHFANLRQIYNSMILATWYKSSLKESLLGKVYIDQNKVKGIDIEDVDTKTKIYDQYIEAFRVGVYDYIKEEYDQKNQSVVARRYFSGGAVGVDSSTLNVRSGDLDRQGDPVIDAVMYPVGQDRRVTWELREAGEIAGNAFVGSEEKDAAALQPISRDMSGQTRKVKISDDITFEIGEYPDGEIKIKNLNVDETKDATINLFHFIQTEDDVVQAMMIMDNLRHHGARKINLTVPKWKTLLDGDRKLLTVLRMFADTIMSQESAVNAEGDLETYLDPVDITHEALPPAKIEQKKLPLKIDRVYYLNEQFADDAHDTASKLSDDVKAKSIKVSRDAPGKYQVSFDRGENPRDKNVVIYASTRSSRQIVELLLSMAALREHGVESISLINSYQSYARQDRLSDRPEKKGEHLSSATILKAIDGFVDHNFTVNVHYGEANGIVGIPGEPDLKVHNLNGSVALAEYMAHTIIEQQLGIKIAGKDLPLDVTRPLGSQVKAIFDKNPIVIVSPDFGAQKYALHAAQELERLLQIAFGVDIKVNAGFLPKWRDKVSGKTSRADNPQLLRITDETMAMDVDEITPDDVVALEELSFENGASVSDSWAFILDDISDTGGTLKSANFILHNNVGIEREKILNGVVHGALSSGLTPFGAQGATEDKLPPAKLFAMETLVLPQERGNFIRVPIRQLARYAIERIIGHDLGKAQAKATVKAKGPFMKTDVAERILDAYINEPGSQAFRDEAKTAGFNPTVLEESIEEFIKLWQVKFPHGLVNPVQLLADNPRLKDFLIRIHGIRSVEGGFPEDLIPRVFDVLMRNRHDPEMGRQMVYREVPELREFIERAAHDWRERSGRRYSGDAPFEQLNEYLTDLPKGAVVVNVGSGKNLVGATIAQNNPDVTVIDTDIVGAETLGRQKENVPINHHFRQQPAEYKIDLPDNSVDVITQSSMAHHVSARHLPLLIREMRRVLKPGGKIILREDTWSHSLPISGDPEFTDEALTRELLAEGDEFAHAFNAFNDWFGNAVVRNITSIPEPYNFHSMEEWKEIYREYGFEQGSSKFYGLPYTRGIMVFEKTDQEKGENHTELPLHIDESTRGVLRDWLTGDYEISTEQEQTHIAIAGQRLPITNEIDIKKLDNRPKRVAIVGGSFNPFHEGHEQIGRAVLEDLDLDEVIFVPNNASPHKQGHNMVPGKVRHRWIESAVKDEPRFSVSDFEINREGPSYTIDTVEHIREQFPEGSQFYFVLGEDNVEGLPTWKGIDELKKQVHFVVRGRPGTERKPSDIPIEAYIERPELDVSATLIRERVATGRSVKDMVTPDIERELSDFYSPEFVFNAAVGSSPIRSGNIKYADKLGRQIPFDKEYAVTLDVHGTLLISTWKDELALVYHWLTGRSEEEGLEWVEERIMSEIILTTRDVPHEVIAERLRQAALRISKRDVDIEHVRKLISDAREKYRVEIPHQAVPGAVEFFERLKKLGLPLQIISGTNRGDIIRQLTDAGFGDLLDGVEVVGRDDQQVQGVADSKYNLREQAILRFQEQHKDRRLIHVNDWVTGMDLTNELGAINVGVLQGEGREQNRNAIRLTNVGVDFLIAGERDFTRLGEIIEILDDKRTERNKSLVKKTLRVAMAQVNPVVGDLEGNFKMHVQKIQEARKQGVDILNFPELSMTGYPPKDLIRRKVFVLQNKGLVQKLAEYTNGMTVQVGFIDVDSKGHVYNGLATLSDGKIVSVYRKNALPNYGVFNEKRYFRPGKGAQLYDFNGRPLHKKVSDMKGIETCSAICEDGWVNREEESQLPDLEDTTTLPHPDDSDRPEVYLEQNLLGAKVQYYSNASPFRAGVTDVRLELFKRRARETGAWIIYTNLAGGQDELVFDGQSFIINPQGEVVVMGKAFEEEMIYADIEVETVQKGDNERDQFIRLDSPEGVKPELPQRELPKRLDKYDEMEEALVLGMRDYFRKNGMKKAILGLSGGIDSAYTAYLAVRALGADNVIAISMPTRYNSSTTKTDARRQAELLGIKAFFEHPIEAYRKLALNDLKELPLDELTGDAADKGKSIFDVTNLVEENIQPKDRMKILYAISNAIRGSLVLSTGNKSEMSVGYFTYGGDDRAGWNAIQDVYKTDVYELSKRVNEKNGREVIVNNTIYNVNASAELGENQKDSDSLPPYPVLDAILKLLIDRNDSIERMVTEEGFDRETVEKVERLIKISQWKRDQAPPGVNLTEVSFKANRTMPKVNRYDETQVKRFIDGFDASTLREITTQPDKVGGIDLNAEHLNLQIQRDANGVPFPVNEQPLLNIQIDGFTPIIINVEPINIPLFLGEKNQRNQKHEAAGNRLNHFFNIRENKYISKKSNLINKDELC